MEARQILGVSYGRSGQTAVRDRLLEGLPVEERRLDIGGVATSVLEAGEGRPVVLLHGGIQAGGVVWRRVIPHLAETYRVVIPDLPGMGESDVGASRLDAATVVRWLAALIQMTCGEQPTLVAHSAPGAFAAHFAIERGDRLRRLVLVDSAGLGPLRPPLGVVAALLRSNVRPNERSFDALMRQVMYDLDRVREEDNCWEAFRSYVASRGALPSVRKTMRQLGKGATRVIPDAELRRIAVPTVLLWGRRDRLIPIRIAEAANANLGWPLHVIDDAGHLPHIEQPDAFVDAFHTAITE